MWLHRAFDLPSLSKPNMIRLHGWVLWMLALLALDVARCGEVKVIQEAKPCAPGCTDRGNCNGETGKCECPWGYKGDACEIDFMAACRQTSDDPGSCGNLWPKNCECYRLCHALYCRDPSDHDRCSHEIGAELFPNGHCWRHNDPAAPLSSQLPEGTTGEGGGVTWYSQFQETAELPKEEWGLSNWRGGNKALPLDRCPGRCSNGRGVCLQWGWQQEATCQCHKGYNGTECEQVDNFEACWFSPDCGGVGTCRSGFCHCQPGYWGRGCHRRTAFQAGPGVGPGEVPDTRSWAKLKIYMYELPWDVAFPFDYNDGQFGRDAMYKAYEYFMTYFLKDNVVRTENPYEANLFYVPMLLYFYIGNVRDPVPQATAVLDYVRTNWPFYNRSGGGDHFYFMTGDRGTCHVPRWMQDSCIKVVHFGMQKERLGWQQIKNPDYGCIQIKRDLVVPPINMFIELLPSHTEAYYEWLSSNGGRDNNRTLLFFFAGGVGEFGEYSGGARQAIKKLLDLMNPRPPDVEFVEGRTASYGELLRKSKFCIAPYGYGWGLRLVQSIEFGCIPIIIQDHVFQAFEDFMPYEEFSVRMRLADVPHMVELLRGFSEEQVAALRLGMAKYYRAFIWNREYGGRAYEWTLAGLQRRLSNLHAGYFGRHLRRRGD